VNNYPSEFPNKAPYETAEAPSGFRHFLLDVLETVAISLILFLAINAVSARIRVDGHSMVPTFQDGEFVIVDKISYRFNDPQRGDIVVFHYPRDPAQEYIKRIIGLPGDEVLIRGGVVYVNGIALVEPYAFEAPRYELQVYVPAGEYFVLGDNRNNSSDSHDWGTLPEEFLVGKAFFIYWPLNEVGIVQSASAAYEGVTP
jgi:signal peptidase I